MRSAESDHAYSRALRAGEMDSSPRLRVRDAAELEQCEREHRSGHVARLHANAEDLHDPEPVAFDEGFEFVARQESAPFVHVVGEHPRDSPSLCDVDQSEPAPSRPCRGREEKTGSDSQHPGCLGDGTLGIGDVLEHLRTDHGVECAIGERQPGYIRNRNSRHPCSPWTRRSFRGMDLPLRHPRAS